MAIANDLSTEILIDLYRSAWLIESARAEVYRGWGEGHASMSEWAAERARVIEKSLATHERAPDEALLTKHADWLRRLVGNGPEEVPLGSLFIARLGDWVEMHAADALVEGTDRLRELGDHERANLAFPDSLPPPPPFQPVTSPEVAAPGEVKFTFGILADLHFGHPRSERAARAAIKDLNAAGPDLVVQLGDLTDHGNKDEFDLALAALSELEMPLVTMMGNHDVYSIAEERLSGREYYAGSFGRDPDGVILEHKGFRFAALDSVEHAASPLPAFDFVSGRFLEGHNAGAIVRGSLTPAQHDVLAEVAAPGSPPAFLFLHHPPQPFLAFPPVLFGLRDADSGRLHATIDSGNVWGVFAGHTHRNARTRDFDGIPAHEVAMPRDYPFGYALVDVSDEGYAFTFVQLSDEELLTEAYKTASVIHRRYGEGSDEERAFTWTRPPGPPSQNP